MSICTTCGRSLRPPTTSAITASCCRPAVLLIEDGEIALDLRVDLPRARERGSPEVAKLEGEILTHLFRNSRAGEDA